jgi:hypothetical protein
MRATDREIVNVLGATGGFGGKSQLFLVAEKVDRGRLSRIRAAGEGHFWDLVFWQILKSIHGREEAGLPK